MRRGPAFFACSRVDDVWRRRGSHYHGTVIRYGPVVFRIPPVEGECGDKLVAVLVDNRLWKFDQALVPFQTTAVIRIDPPGFFTVDNYAYILENLAGCVMDPLDIFAA
jgi:hypothetical protein